MGSSKPQSSNQKFFIATLIVIASFLIILIFSFKPLLPFTLLHSCPTKTNLPPPRTIIQTPPWFRFINNRYDDTTRLRVGYLNVPEEERDEFEARGPRIAENVHVSFDPVSKNVGWNDLFPQWIDEEEKYHKPRCPEIPLVGLEGLEDLDVVVARVPCDGYSKKRGFRDVLRLQVNLAAANLAVGRSGGGFNRTVYVVLVGSCGPMQEIFRCDDLVTRVGDLWVYKPDIEKLRNQVVMPVGSCQISPLFSNPNDLETDRSHRARQAYVTVIHSSEAYVCGAIALAQSIRQSGSIRDLVLLHDDSLTAHSLSGLKTAGWKLKKIERIRSPFSKKDSYNEWNYSKLRVWQLTNYDKVIFIDADFIVLRNLDHLFRFPHLSAAGNNEFRFNSGVMVLQPSTCTFKALIKKSYTVESYNGGDQGFLNEVFVWWHRLPRKVNHMKFFMDGKGNDSESLRREVPEDIYALHYLGLKPWTCYRDYDCNWDMEGRHKFASDSAHEKWWRVYDKMPGELKRFCGLSEKMDWRIRKWRGIARESGLYDRHWEIDVKDPRKDLLIQ